MSKKKAFTGSTMTLKDFHGGSIPSDLPLPSAPGVTVRPVDRPGLDRQSSWGATMGRPDYRSRPQSSPSIRTFDEKSPFLAPTMHLGRNFDEDERKPLNSDSAPRRMIGDDSFRPMEVWVGEVNSGRLSGQTGLGNVNGSVATSYSSRVAEKTNAGMGLSPCNFGSKNGSSPNAWAARKEAVGITEPSQPAWSESIAVSKLAHASALEKVTSGRWQTKISVHQHTDAESVRYPELESGAHFRTTNNFSYRDRSNVEEKESDDVMLARNAERGLHIRDRVQYRDQQAPVSESTRSSFPSETKETKRTPYRDGGELSLSDLKFSGAELKRPLSSDALERPKLKFLPRSKPLESYEQSAINHKQGYPKPADSVHHETQVEEYEIAVPIKPGSGGSESGNRTVDRPKLNLKPRSHLVQYSEAIVERERNTLFGGALPREVVLKERGINDVADSSDLIQSSNRNKTDVRNEVASKHIPYRHGDKSENMSFDHQSSKNIDRRRGLRVDVERADAQRRNWRNDVKRNDRETEKQQQERPPSPETWRKPNTELPDATGVRNGKAASAVELAQAFSRSMSESKMAEHSPIQRSVNSRTQIPFSRLTASSPRPQINGY